MSAALTAESGPEAVGEPPQKRGLLRRLGELRASFRRGKRKLRFTREGKVFVLLTFGIGVGAVNTGNNLLYMLLGSMLAFIVLSGVLAEISLRGVVILRRVPARLHAGQETSIQVVLRNTKRHLPSFSLAVRETFGKGRLLDPVSFVHLAPGERADGRYRCVFPRRGRCRFRRWTLLTTFPFGLFEKSREVEGPGTAIVYPRIDLPVEIPFLVGGGAGEGQERRGAGSEFYALREYRVGDDRRQIAWKQSARRRNLVVRENARGAESAVELVVLNVATETRRDLRFESALDHAASLALRLLRSGYSVGLTSFDDPIPAGTGADQVRRLLTALALMRQVNPDEAGAGLIESVVGPRKRIVVETAASQPWRPGGELTVVHVMGADDEEVPRRIDVTDPGVVGPSAVPRQTDDTRRPRRTSQARITRASDGEEGDVS